MSETLEEFERQSQAWLEFCRRPNVDPRDAFEAGWQAGRTDAYNLLVTLLEKYRRK